MKYWKRVDTAGKTTTVESYSHDLDIKGATKITKKEYDAFIASLPVTIVQPTYFEAVNPSYGQEQRLERIEEFLSEQFPEPSQSSPS